jgi:hypothetical protein
VSALLSTAYPLLKLQLDEFLKEFAQLKKEPAEAGVAVDGPGAAYALVWEWGNARQMKKGPKTTLGTNPDGSRVWLSIQAPHGYIRVNEPLFWAAFMREAEKLDLSSESPAEIRQALEQTVIITASRVRDIIKEHVPVDTGQLQSDIVTVLPGDEILSEAEDFGALLLTGA